MSNDAHDCGAPGILTEHHSMHAGIATTDMNLKSLVTCCTTESSQQASTQNGPTDMWQQAFEGQPKHVGCQEQQLPCLEWDKYQCTKRALCE